MSVVIVKDKLNPMRKPFAVNKDTAENTPHYEVLSTDIKPVVKKKESEVAAVNPKEQSFELLEDEDVLIVDNLIQYTDGALELITEKGLDEQTLYLYFRDHDKKITKRDIEQYLKRK